MPTLVKQSLLPELDAMERRFRRLWEGMPFLPAMLPGVPAADVYETATEIVFELEVPGYEERELDLEIAEHTLTVTGRRMESTGGDEKAYRITERLEHTFERTFVLPAEVDDEHVVATFDKGILTVHAPKIGGAVPRKVAIEHHA